MIIKLYSIKPKTIGKRVYILKILYYLVNTSQKCVCLAKLFFKLNTKACYENDKIDLMQQLLKRA